MDHMHGSTGWYIVSAFLQIWSISPSSELTPAVKSSLWRYFANAGASNIRRTSLTPFSMISASRSSDRKRGSMRGGASGSLLVNPTSPREYGLNGHTRQEKP